jgi:hypothetical protein
VIINTRSGTLGLAKREYKTLADAKSLLLQISKHGTGSLSENAAEAAEVIGLICSELGSQSSPDLPGQKKLIDEDA